MSAPISSSDLFLLYHTNEIISQWVEPSGKKQQRISSSTLSREELSAADYLVASQSFKISRFEFFNFERPGGGLIASKEVVIKAEEIFLQGTSLRPITIIGTKGIFLRAKYIELRHVTFLSTSQASFVLDSPDIIMYGVKLGHVKTNSREYNVEFNSFNDDSATVEDSP